MARKSLEISSSGGTPIPGVCVRVAGKGLTRHGVRKSGMQRTYREVFLRFDATDEFPKGYPHPGCFAERGWIRLIPKALTFLERPKRLQEHEKKGVSLVGRVWREEYLSS